MKVKIDVEGQSISFRVDVQGQLWHCDEDLEQAVFPLITVIKGKRYELYSDGTLAEVEK